MITSEEKKRYPLVEKDAEILKRIHDSEEIRNLNEDERFLLLFLRTQLEKDWRKYCLDLLKTWIEFQGLTPEKRWTKLKEVQKGWWNPRGI